MDHKQMLYNFEHGLLPKWFYEEKRDFIGLIAQQPQALYSILSELYTRSEMDNPFTPDEFRVEPEQLNEDVAMLKIRFPKPPAAPLCISAVVVFDKTFEKVCYYSIEKGDEVTGGFPVVCSWEADGTHVNYGAESHDEDECLVKCVSLYMERFFDAPPTEV